MNELLLVSEAASRLRVCPKTILHMIARGDLDGIRLGRRTIRVRAASLDRLIN
jgi:excisionase family DNA binding protein